MHKAKIFFLSLFSVVAGVPSSFAEMSSQVGVGYGKELQANENLAQYEVFWRQPLPYKTTLGDSWSLATDMEMAAALLREEGSDNDEAGRFSVMPRVIFSPHAMINFIVGLGAGFMVGETEFTDQNLGGSFLFNAKVGAQLVLGEHWGLEYVFYHQSNADIYDHNIGLNMHHFALLYIF
jgi:hypothetical protein